MYCETCPIIDHCHAYTKAGENNRNSYHPQNIIRVSSWDEPGCPLLEVIKPIIARQALAKAENK